MNKLHFILLFVSAIASYVSASDKLVVCYYGTWATYRYGLGKFDVDNINTELCTHIVYTFVGIDAQGTVSSLDPYLDLPDNWGRDNFGKFNALKQKNPGLKTILAVGGWNELSAKYSVMAASPTLRKNFITSALAMVRAHGFDGLDVDWEYPNRRDSVNGAEDKENFTKLLQELREECDKDGLLLTAAVASVKDMASLSYDIAEISKSLDIISVMAYDMYGAWDPVTGHNSPLHKGEGDDDVDEESLYTVDVALKYWLQQGCPPQKIVLGVPLYGRTFTLTDPNVNSVRAPSSGAGLAGPYTATNGVIGYNEFCLKLQTESWNQRYDSLAKVPYAFKERDWVSYDNASSLAAKVEYAMQYNIGGIMVWSIETDDFHGVCGNGDYPLLRTINKVLARNISEFVNKSEEATTGMTEEFIPTTPRTQTTDVTCESIGFIANPDDCAAFYMCIQENGNLVPKPFRCPTGLYWDQSNQYCNYPENVDCRKQKN